MPQAGAGVCRCAPSRLEHVTVGCVGRVRAGRTCRPRQSSLRCHVDRGSGGRWRWSRRPRCRPCGPARARVSGAWTAQCGQGCRPRLCRHSRPEPRRPRRAVCQSRRRPRRREAGWSAGQLRTMGCQPFPCAVGGLASTGFAAGQPTVSLGGVWRPVPWLYQFRCWRRVALRTHSLGGTTPAPIVVLGRRRRPCRPCGGGGTS